MLKTDLDSTIKSKDSFIKDVCMKGGEVMPSVDKTDKEGKGMVKFCQFYPADGGLA